MACAAFARRWPILLTTGAAAFVVASPFLYSIGLQYHFRVVHTEPLSWVWNALTLDTLPQFLKDNAVLIALAAFGAVITTVPFLLVWVAGATGAAALRHFAADSADPSLPLLEVGDGGDGLSRGHNTGVALLGQTRASVGCSTRIAAPLPPG